MPSERDVHVKTVLGFMTAAQTVLAVYASPDGPTDPLACYTIMAEILEDPALLCAQLALAQTIIPHCREQSIASDIFVGGGGIGQPAYLNEDTSHGQAVCAATSGQ